jgi:hypothetical protein
MKLETVFQPREGGADIYIASDQKDPSWMVLRWNEADNKLSGYAGSPSGYSLPSVRPVAFQHRKITPESVGMMATWAFMSAFNLKGVDENNTGPASLYDRLGEWESFLSEDERKKDDEIVMSNDEHVTLTEEQSKWLARAGMITRNSNVFICKRKNEFVLGQSISGFQAVAVRDAVRGIFKQIPDRKVGNIEAAKNALKAVKRPSSHAVLWYGTEDPELSRVRGQAAQSFPVLAGMIADNPILSRAVDNQVSLQPLLIERTGLSKAGLKRIGRLNEGLPVGRLFESAADARGEDALGVNRLRRFTVSGEISLDIALKYLSELPPDRVPQDDKSWLAYHDILAGCAIPLENALDIPVKQTLGACKGDWLAFKDQLAKAADFDPKEFDRRCLALTTIDALEAIEDMSKTAVLPVALSSILSVGEEVPEVSSEFFASAYRVAGLVAVGKTKNVGVTLLEMARRYSSRIPSLNELSTIPTDSVENKNARFARYGNESFPKFIEPFTARNGLVIRSLDNFSKMRLESDRLKHCVGRLYLQKAYKANCFILSVQNFDGSESYSTVEIGALYGDTMEEARSKLYIVQHRAFNNAVPSAECTAAVSQLMEDLSNGYTPFNHEEIMAWRECNQDIADLKVTWDGVTEIDWMEEDVRHDVWQEWRYIVGGQYGKSAAPEVIFREKDARDLVAAMNAKAASLLIEKSKKPKPEPKPEPDQDMMEMSGP